MATNKIDNAYMCMSTNRNSMQNSTYLGAPFNQGPKTLAFDFTQQATGNTPDWIPAGTTLAQN